MQKKKIFGMTIVVLLVLSLLIPTTTFARDTDYTNGASFNWSPYSWLGDDSISSGTLLGYLNNVKFDSTATNIHNGSYYLTFEINNTTDNLPHSGWYASNLPNAKFDRDDDNGNGYSEEAEAYIGTITSYITANKAYYFQTEWTGATGKSGNLDFVIQRSINNFVSGEMEAYHYDKLTNSSW